MPRRFAPVLLVFALSTFAGIYFATQLHYAYPPSERAPLGIALIVNLIYYWAWGAAVPAVLALARRYPLDETSWKRSLGAHTVASLLLTALQIAVAATLLRCVWVFESPDMLIRPLLATVLGAMRVNFHSSYPTYWVILFAYLTFDYAAKYRDRASHAAQLEGRLAEARLQALRMQLNPHFLFNTLNSISSLMYSDVEAADAMMTRLSELLRLTLHSDGRPETSLRQELEMLNRYIEIERIRFEERLRVSVDVDQAALDAGVPSFSLQPLVENAIRHAIAPRAGGGSLVISARRDNGTVRISLRDDGPGLPAGEALREGVGLANTRARFEQLYGSAHSFEMSSPPGGGLEICLTLPYRPAVDEGTPLRALIVDDERLAREKVRRLLDAESDVQIAGECGSGAEAVALLRSQKVDLVFLDIQMPGLSGFDVLREVGPASLPHVVFVTAHDEFAVQAFEVQALDYLLKPFDSARFRETLARVRKRNAGELQQQVTALLAQIGARELYAERMLVKGAGRLSFVRVDEIDWIEAADNYVRLHSGREEHLLRETMNGVESRLDPQRFVRVHRSAIVNVEAVKEIQPMFHGDYEVLLRNGKLVPVGRNYRDRLLKTLGG